MDPPNKRRRLAPKLPDPPPPPAQATAQSVLPAPDQTLPAPIDPPIPAALDASSSDPSERHDFETFAKHLQDAATYIYRQGQKPPYAHVSALLLKWDDDVAASGDVSSLERVLRDRYNFHTVRWGIPTVANPSASLSLRVANFLNQASADHLLIIYYVGHGYNGPDGQLYWACNARDDSAKIKWGGVRCLFEDAQSDILVLLDSCAPQDTPIAGSHGAKQAIAAYAPEAGPRELGSRTFTSYLVESLHKLGNGRPFNSQRLYDEIVATQQTYERQYPPRLRSNGAGNLTPLASQPPLFLTLTPGEGHQSVDLAPMPRGHASSPPRNGSGPDLKPHGRNAPAISPAAVADMVFDEARVLVCTTFVGDAGPDMACFNQWISNTPALASKVAVEGMFLGPPTVLLISIPQSLWNVIQHDKICFSLGYINSRNLIHLYDELLKASTAPAPWLGAHASARDVEDGRTLLEAREAATNNNRSPSHRNDYHAPSYQPQPQQLPLPAQHQHHQQPQQQQQQQQQQLPPPPPQLQQQQQQYLSPPHRPILPPISHSQPSLPLPVPQRQQSQHITSPYHEPNATAQFEPTAPHARRDSISQLQQQPQYTPSAHVPPLPRIVSRSGSPALAKEDSEDSAEMKEAAEQLEALRRPSNGNNSPPFSASSHLLKIAQDVIKCQADDSTSEDADMKASDEAAAPAKKGKTKKDYRFKAAKSQEGQSARSRSKSDLPPQTLPSLLPQGSRQDVHCDWCSHEPFKDQSSLRKHVASAHTRPFPCAFAFAGCNSTFGSKNEWKRHIASQHLCLQYYRCSDCTQSSVDGKGNEFNRKDLFTQHLRRMHAPHYIRKAIQKRDSVLETEWEDYVKEMQATCCIVRRLPPQRSACPRLECNRLFEGRSAWDEWTEHVGRHMENGEGESLSVDELLVSWALEEGIITRVEDGSYRLCNPLGPGTGGTSSNGNSNSNSNSNSNNNSNGNPTLPVSNSRSPSNVTEEDVQHRSLPQIPVASFGGADANASPAFSQQDSKLVMPPTPPPTTTRPPMEGAEMADASEMAGDAKPQHPPAEKSASVEDAKTIEAAGKAMLEFSKIDAPSAASRAEEWKKAAEPRKGGEPHTERKRLPDGPREQDAIVSRKVTSDGEPAKLDDLSGLQSITVAAIAAAAALQEQENATLAKGAAMDVDS